MDTKSTSHCRYNINYHLVWCSKYRHQVLIGEIEIFLKGLIDTICQNYGYELLNSEIMPDHLHLFVSAPPTIAPTDIVKTIKSITAVKIFKQFPKLKAKKFWGSGIEYYVFQDIIFFWYRKILTQCLLKFYKKKHILCSKALSFVHT